MRIGITGGTGFLGRALAARARERGWEVRVLTRRPERTRRMVPETETAEWNPESGPPAVQILEDLDVVVHLAGEPIAAGRWTAERKRRIRESRVRGTEHLAAAWKRAERPPGVLVAGSAVGYYGDRGDDPLDEDAPPGDDFLARVTREWERAAEPVRERGTRLVHLRTGVVLGPGGGALARMLPPFRLGLGGRLGSGRQWMPWIHLRDWTDLVLHAVEHEGVDGALNAVAPLPVRNGEFVRTLGRVLRRPALVPVPAFVLRLLLGELAEALLASQRALPRRALFFSYRFAFPELERALREILGGEGSLGSRGG